VRLDEVTAALTRMWRRLLAVDTMYTAEGTSRRIFYINSLKHELACDNPKGFIDFTQEVLAGWHGDTMVDLLEELYVELGLSDKTDIDAFKQAYLA